MRESACNNEDDPVDERGFVPHASRKRWTVRRTMWCCSLLGLSVPLMIPVWIMFRPNRPPDVSRETTFLTAPVRPDGYVDYLAAVLQETGAELADQRPGQLMAASSDYASSTMESAAVRFRGPPPLSTTFDETLMAFYRSERGLYRFPEPGVAASNHSLRHFILKNADAFSDLLKSAEQPWRLFVRVRDQRAGRLWMSHPDCYVELCAWLSPLIQVQIGNGNLVEAWSKIDVLRRMAARQPARPRLMRGGEYYQLETAAALHAAVALLHSVESTDVERSIQSFRPTEPLSPAGNYFGFFSRLNCLSAATSDAQAHPPRVSFASWNRLTESARQRWNYQPTETTPRFRFLNETFDRLRGDLFTVSRWQQAADILDAGAMQYFPDGLRRRKDLRDRWRYSILIETGLVSARRLLEAHYSLEAARRMVHVAQGLQRYRLRFGRYPASLSEAIRQRCLDDSWTIDPFSGESFCYRQNSKEGRLWTVGPNQTDDDGTIDGTLMTRSRSHYIGFQWLPPDFQTADDWPHIIWTPRTDIDAKP